MDIDERLLHVDRHGALVVPAVLWLAMAFLCRYWLVVIFVLAGTRRSPDTIRLLGQDFHWYMLALELPALLMLLAGLNRKPMAGAFWRALWANGRWILITIATLHVATAAILLVASPGWRRWPELFIASCAVLDLAIVIGLLRDAFFRQLFADYPAPPRAPGTT